MNMVSAIGRSRVRVPLWVRSLYPRHTGLASLLRPNGDRGRSEDAIDAEGTQKERQMTQ
ncbi:hypothetical protein DPMN_047070 [Dreissena polymorpha]|uniref:Uncharacterized protein n=1 Tax=Dreissena polymorpha TaxID=45954 RepID=A0A9D4I143_DREPO|nr:hypothetical protein DPMN_047070 [Dreissena polymorpha]